ncbi:iron permease [Clavulina sp. PMI_390]|nr:iron permease [Clavulina sp. PMI_390]
MAEPIPPTVALAETDPIPHPEPGTEAYKSTKKPLQFWLVFLGTCISLFLAALELTSVSTALPTIIHDLPGSNFIWVGSAYAIASAASMPTAGGLADIFGRRSIMLGSIGIFAVGSALAGAAQSLNMLIAARAIQGAGGGGILALSEIILADMVNLRERGKYGGLLGIAWVLASVLGPPVGGGLAGAGQWRWLFYLNLPLSLVAAILVTLFLRLRTPGGTMSEKIRRIDWMYVLQLLIFGICVSAIATGPDNSALNSGNGIIIASTVSIILALTWGGIQYPWSSYHVLVPLLLGVAGIGAFLVYEWTIAVEPIVPYRIVNNRTTASGMTTTFLMGMVLTMVTYYLPTYFQGSKGASPIRSGILIFGSSFIAAPLAVLTGQSVQRTGHYLLQNYIGWAFILIGYGCLSTLRTTTDIATSQGIQIVAAIGLGMLQVGPMVAILAPLEVEDNAHALSMMVYIRTFGQTFGITIGTTILQNGLKSRLPDTLLATFPEGVEISYSIIPLISSLGMPLRRQVQDAFAISISKIWLTVVGLAGAAVIATLPMKQITLREVLDEKWGFETQQEVDERKARDIEQGGTAVSTPAIEDEDEKKEIRDGGAPNGSGDAVSATQLAHEKSDHPKPAL